MNGADQRAAEDRSRVGRAALGFIAMGIVPVLGHNETAERAPAAAE